ncbi:MAG: 16S rRNA (cytidine(1402)-2'-O)-methyltransferase [Firmicutes bacterium]|nr:16S rRNA (cytidine(1402)-2'-O)-methyltransferase [Bacillota bacterium]
MPAAVGSGRLYLCATPIGNLEDITLRVLRILGQVNVIAAEDTRRTRKLLRHYDIKTPLVSYHEHNRRARGEELLGRLAVGEDIALVSDAGMPAIADPGTELVQGAIASGIPVEVLPGPTALITALALSGLPADSFVFAGFPPRRGRERVEYFSSLARERRTIVLYESPHRLLATLTDLAKGFGERWLVVARELTKRYEEVRRGPISQHISHFQRGVPRGEFCLILAGAPAPEGEITPAQVEGALNLVADLVGLGVVKKEAIKLAARERGLPRRYLYQAALKVDK